MTYEESVASYEETAEAKGQRPLASFEFGIALRTSIQEGE